MSDQEKKKIKRRLTGIVVSTKMDRTIVVKVARTKVHPKYIKRYKVHKNYLVDDPKGEKKAGDEVNFQECRPLSKNKRWRIVYNRVDNKKETKA